MPCLNRIGAITIKFVRVLFAFCEVQRWRLSKRCQVGHQWRKNHLTVLACKSSMSQTIFFLLMSLNSASESKIYFAETLNGRKKNMECELRISQNGLYIVVTPTLVGGSGSDKRLLWWNVVFSCWWRWLRYPSVFCTFSADRRRIHTEPQNNNQGS